MNQTPLVSILMTAYNREIYIAESIESVLASTYTNFELIIVDDCSKDNTVEIARSYEAKDKRIQVYVNESNLGDYPNRNKAASYANGKYLKYLDSDDLIYPICLEVIIKGMEKFPNAGFGQIAIDQNNDAPFPILVDPPEIFQMNYFKGINIFSRSPLSSIFVKEIFNKEGGFSGKRGVGDFELFINLSAKYSLVLLQPGLAWNRVHSDTESKKNANWFFIIEYLKIELENIQYNYCPLSKEEIAKIKKRIRNRILHIFISMLLRLKLRETLFNFNKIKNLL